MLAALGIHGLNHRTWADKAYMRKYVIASRHGFHDGASLAITDDKSRNSGKDWLVANVLCFETGKIAWATPSVQFRFLSEPTPLLL